MSLNSDLTSGLLTHGSVNRSATTFSVVERIEKIFKPLELDPSQVRNPKHQDDLLVDAGRQEVIAKLKELCG